MLLPVVVYAVPCEDVTGDAATARTGKGEGDLRKRSRIRSRFLGGCGDKFISMITWEIDYLHQPFVRYVRAGSGRGD
jgi:hypothetical protein